MCASSSNHMTPIAASCCTRGRTTLVTADDLAADRYPGALEIVTRQEAVDMLGRDDPTDREIEELAANLDTAMSEMGG